MYKKVTVFIPVFNEEKYIKKVLNEVIDQDWPGEIEVLVVDGMSTDNTLEIVKEVAASAQSLRQIKILFNQKRHIPIALNIACNAASSDILIRLDGHTYPPKNYITQMVQALEYIQYHGIVGGRCQIYPGQETNCAYAIACAVAHPFGIGNAMYRTFNDKNKKVPKFIKVDTVPFGAFTKNLWKNLGGYDDLLLGDEDSDFVYRAKKLGYNIWLIPEVILQYMARPDLKSLWNQYFRYGYWVSHFLIKHKIVPSYRKIIPFIFIMSVFLSIFIKPIISILILLLHTSVATITAIITSIYLKKGISFALYLIMSFIALHWAYGLGNLFGLVKFDKRIVK